MPETNTGKARIVVKAEKFVEAVRKRMRLRLMLAAQKVADRVKVNISQPSNKGMTPSKPGEMPHADTGLLRNSIIWRMTGDLEAIVGTTLAYGLYLEYGVAGGVTIYPRSAKALSWIDPQTGERRFAKSVKLGRIEGRSFLRRTVLEMSEEIRRILTGGGATGAEVEVG